MLQWNELRITPDGRTLIIDVSVQNLDFYEYVYLRALKYVIYRKPEDYGDLTKGIVRPLWRDFNFIPQEGEVYEEVGTEGTLYKRIRKFIDIDSIGDNIFFVYAVTTDEPTQETPCTARDLVLSGIVYNNALLYKNSIKALGALKNCTPSTSLIDYILKVKAFDLSVETGDYKAALEYWNNTFKVPVENTNIANCNCNGD